MSFLSRPFKNQFSFHENIEVINVTEPTEITLDPTGATVKIIKLLNTDSSIINLKIQDIDVLKYKLSSPKLISIKVIIRSKFKTSLHLDDSIALCRSISNDFELLPNHELSFLLFTYNTGDHWNGYVTTNYNIMVGEVNKKLTSIDLPISTSTVYTFGTDVVRPLPGNADTAVVDKVSYGMTSARSNTYYSNTNLNGLVSIIGNGFQSFTLPENVSTSILSKDIVSYDVEITVQGANGGNNISANNSDKTYVGYGGRGAVIKGVYKDVKPGQLFYLLIGHVGSCSNYSSSGGGGGGASMIFVPDDSFRNNVIFEPTSEIVRPLIIAGGGAGRYGTGYSSKYNVSGGVYDIANDNAHINAKYTNGNFDLGLTTYGQMTIAGSHRTFAGASLLAGYGRYGRSVGVTGNMALLKNPDTTITYRPGGFGGGGGTEDWGGGGGGLNGGDGDSKNILLSGGTSWTDSIIEDVSRSLVPLNEIINQSPPQGKIIIRILTIHYYSYVEEM